MSEWTPTEWVSQVTAAARQDLDDLIAAALPIVTDRIDREQPFVPFAVTLHHDGEVHIRQQFLATGQDPGELVPHLWGVLLASAQSLRAAVVVEKGGDDSFPVMEMMGDHREAPAFVLHASWRRKPRMRVFLATAHRSPDELFA